mmetsp:Transcript_28265/g.68701  ORF Transcript_28265/g.68701 Transcript_28265/m.68701 type:complete len:394 (+) Transcript_28265:246-1427(+)
MILDDELRAVPIAAMAHCEDKIPAEYLEDLSKSAPNFRPYKDLPLSVRRRVMHAWPKVLTDEATPYITRLVLADGHMNYFSVKIMDDLYDDPKEMRRREANPDLKYLVDTIGSDKALYRHCCKLIQEETENNGFQIGYSNLRYDLLLAIREAAAAAGKPVVSDRFAPMCEIIRDNLMQELEETQVDTIFQLVNRNFSDHAEGTAADAYGRDICLLLSSAPFVLTLTWTLIRGLRQHKDSKEYLESNFLAQLVYLIAVGVEAHRIMKNGPFQETAIQMLQNYMQMVLMIVELIRGDEERALLPDDGDLPSDEVERAVGRNRFMRRVFTAHAYDRLVERDVIGYTRLAKPLRACFMESDPLREVRERYLSDYLIQRINMDIVDDDPSAPAPMILT